MQLPPDLLRLILLECDPKNLNPLRTFLMYIPNLLNNAFWREYFYRYLPFEYRHVFQESAIGPFTVDLEFMKTLGLRALQLDPDVRPNDHYARHLLISRDFDSNYSWVLHQHDSSFTFNNQEAHIIQQMNKYPKLLLTKIKVSIRETGVGRIKTETQYSSSKILSNEYRVIFDSIARERLFRRWILDVELTMTPILSIAIDSMSEPSLTFN